MVVAKVPVAVIDRIHIEQLDLWPLATEKDLGDDTARTIDYAIVADTMGTLVSRNDYNLIETVTKPWRSLLPSHCARAFFASASYCQALR